MMRVGVLVVTWWWLSLASATKATTDDDLVNSQESQASLAKWAAQMGEDLGEQASLDDSQQPVQAPYQQPTYDYQQDQGFSQQPVQQPAPAERFLATAPYAQAVPGAAQPPLPASNPVQGTAPAQSPVQVASAQQGQRDLTVTIAPADGSEDAASGAASHLQHGTTFSICDMLPPPLMIVCVILEFLIFTWPLYYIWIALICLLILLKIYQTFKETLDPIIIAILDAIYLVVWVVVRTCQFIWSCIKAMAYPIKESILGCSDRIDGYLNPWKQRRPHTHVPGFSY